MNNKRKRKFLHEHEVATLIDLCKQTRHPLRNETLVMVTYNHALRVGEMCNMTWDQVDFKNDRISIIRQKGGVDGIHPLLLREKDLLLELYKTRDKKLPYVFTSERKMKFKRINYHKLIQKLGILAEFPFAVHPHMLRHAKGTFLAEQDVPLLKIKNYLGHKRLSSTEFYMHLAAKGLQDINNGSMFC